MFSRITLKMKNVNCLLTVIFRQRPLNFCQMPWFVVTSYEALWRKLKRLSNMSSSLFLEVLRRDNDGFFMGAVTGLISSSSPLFKEISRKERSLLCKLCLGEVEKPSTSSLTGFAPTWTELSGSMSSSTISEGLYVEIRGVGVQFNFTWTGWLKRRFFYASLSLRRSDDFFSTFSSILGSSCFPKLTLEYCGFISAETVVDVECSALSVLGFFLILGLLLLDANAKKPTAAVGEGMFKVTLVFVSAMMSSKETADAVSACIDNVCELVEVLELLREACSWVEVRHFWYTSNSSDNGGNDTSCSPSSWTFISGISDDRARSETFRTLESITGEAGTKQLYKWWWKWWWW